VLSRNGVKLRKSNLRRLKKQRTDSRASLARQERD
jgi:hypothetical protein